MDEWMVGAMFRRAQVCKWCNQIYRRCISYHGCYDTSLLRPFYRYPR